MRMYIDWFDTENFNWKNFHCWRHTSSSRGGIKLVISTSLAPVVEVVAVTPHLILDVALYFQLPYLNSLATFIYI